jgi:hypothetical protein
MRAAGLHASSVLNAFQGSLTWRQRAASRSGIPPYHLRQPEIVTGALDGPTTPVFWNIDKSE